MGKKVADRGWAEIVGLPDAWDKKNIQALVNTFFNTVFKLPVSDEPGAKVIKVTGRQWAAEMLADARDKHGLNDVHSSDYGEKSKQMEMRIITSVPQPLYMKLLEGYPTLFKDTKQQLWFAKNFPEFKVPRRL